MEGTKHETDAVPDEAAKRARYWWRYVKPPDALSGRGEEINPATGESAGGTNVSR